MYCWGNNSTGQLGNGTATSTTSPPSMGISLAGVTQMAIGDCNTGAVAGGSLYLWGCNYEGQLANGGTSSQPTPLLINLPTAWARWPSAAARRCAP